MQELNVTQTAQAIATIYGEIEKTLLRDAYEIGRLTYAKDERRKELLSALSKFKNVKPSTVEKYRTFYVNCTKTGAKIANALNILKNNDILFTRSAVLLSIENKDALLIILSKHIKTIKKFNTTECENLKKLIREGFSAEEAMEKAPTKQYAEYQEEQKLKEQATEAQPIAGDAEAMKAKQETDYKAVILRLFPELPETAHESTEALYQAIMQAMKA